MGIIKKHIIREKFEEDSDPIEDLGIGGFDEFEETFKQFISKSIEGYWSSISEIYVTLPGYINIKIFHHPYNDNFKPTRHFAQQRSGFDKYIKKDWIHKSGSMNDHYIYEVESKYYYILKQIDKIKYTKKHLPGHTIKNQEMYTYDVEIIWKFKKMVKEYLNEKFVQDSDPISDMNIGTKTQILNDIKKIGIKPDDIQFHDDYSFFMKNGHRRQPTTFLDIQLKYFPEGKKKLLQNLEKTKKPITEIIDEALKDGVKSDDIMYIIKYCLSNVDYSSMRYKTANEDITKANIYLTKLKRTKKQKDEDEENNIYVFIGYTEKVPIIIKGKKYYEDKLGTEGLIKIDKFNTADLQSISMMKMRLMYQQYEDGAVYMITVPKFLMDEDRYNTIPDELYDIIDKYKKKI